MSIQFNTPVLAGFTNATVCNEPLFLYVEKKIGELPDGINCTVSPFAFCVEDEVIDDAKKALEEHDIVEIGDENEMLVRFTRKESGNVKKIHHRTIKTPFDFYEESERVKMSVIYKHIENGVIFVSLDGVVISPFAEIGRRTEIHSSTEIRGKSVIGENCKLGPNSVIENSKVGSNSKVIASHVYDSEIEGGVSIGPFSHVKVNSKISAGARTGAFVEIKNSNIGRKTSALHLTYLGDSDVGDNVNFGCGTITCNYDGKNKHRTTIEDNVFVGCNTNLVAPITLGKGSFVAAGSTVIENVPEGALAIARAHQTVKEGWAERKRSEGKLK